MTYQEFKKDVIGEISTRLGVSYRIALQDIVKNNDTHLDGLTILSEHSNISPTIYLNYYYEQYLAGKSLSNICDDIFSIYQNNAPTENIDISFFTDFQKVKGRLIFKLINYERNQKLLSKVPHIRYLDLAIVFNCLVDTASNGIATILIHHHHMTFWNISLEELHALAIKNTPILLSSHLQNMTDVLTQLLTAEHRNLQDVDIPPLPMYVLSNKSKLNGAGSILYKNLLSDIADELESDLYILPSSIHEVLLIPVKHASSYEELSLMVNEVNRTQLAKEEILSDHVYYFSRIKGTLTL